MSSPRGAPIAAPVPPRRRLRRLVILAGGAGLAVLAVVAVIAALQDEEEPDGVTSTAVPTAPPEQAAESLVLTYFFYWYDARTGGHLREADGLRHHLPPAPAPDWRSAAWFKSELSDMERAGIDVALAVYWGENEDWSPGGLPVMADARSQLLAEGRSPPRIGLFLDTTIVAGRDLTSPDGKDWFYRQFHDFFAAVPREHWALVNGKPVAFLFTSDWTAAFDQSTFDFVYQSFERDFGVRPYIVREVSWDYPILRWEGGVQTGTRVRAWQTAVRTENNYLWAAAQHGYVDRGGVAAVGPGYDDTLVPGRGGFVQEREGGAWYQQHFDAAIASGKRLLVIETWNEIHEGSGIGRTVEFGAQYIDLTRELTGRFQTARQSGND